MCSRKTWQYSEAACGKVTGKGSIITFVVTHTTPGDLAKSAPFQPKALRLYVNVCVHDTNQNRRWALHTGPAFSGTAPVAGLLVGNTCFIWCGGPHIRRTVKGRHEGKSLPWGRCHWAKMGVSRESSRAVISESGLSHHTVAVTWTRNKRPLRRDPVAGVGVHEGMDGMSHLELTD